MSPSRNPSYDERTNREEAQPSITVGFRNFGLGHLIVSGVVLLAGGGLWLHGDATHEATATDMASKLEASRQILVTELSQKLDQRLAPVESKVEEYEKSVNALKIELARLTQAINDMERLPHMKTQEDLGTAVRPLGTDQRS